MTLPPNNDPTGGRIVEGGRERPVGSRGARIESDIREYAFFTTVACITNTDTNNNENKTIARTRISLCPLNARSQRSSSLSTTSWKQLAVLRIATPAAPVTGDATVSDAEQASQNPLNSFLFRQAALASPPNSKRTSPDVEFPDGDSEPESDIEAPPLVPDAPQETPPDFAKTWSRRAVL